MPRWSMTASALGECHLGVMVTRPADAASWGPEAEPISHDSRVRIWLTWTQDSIISKNTSPFDVTFARSQSTLTAAELRSAQRSSAQRSGVPLSATEFRFTQRSSVRFGCSSLFLLLSLRFSSPAIHPHLRAPPGSARAAAPLLCGDLRLPSGCTG